MTDWSKLRKQYLLTFWKSQCVLFVSYLFMIIEGFLNTFTPASKILGTALSFSFHFVLSFMSLPLGNCVVKYKLLVQWPLSKFTDPLFPNCRSVFAS